MELDATDEQLDFPLVYASARSGIAKLHMNDEGKDLTPLFDTILKYCPCPEGDADGDCRSWSPPLKLTTTSAKSLSAVLPAVQLSRA